MRSLAEVRYRFCRSHCLVCYFLDDKDVARESRGGEAALRLVVLARDERDFGQFAHLAPRWVRLVSAAGDPRWDDYTNVLGVLEE
jgi:hypothetical protein